MASAIAAAHRERCRALQSLGQTLRDNVSSHSVPSFDILKTHPFTSGRSSCACPAARRATRSRRRVRRRLLLAVIVVRKPTVGHDGRCLCVEMVEDAIKLCISARVSTGTWLSGRLLVLTCRRLCGSAGPLAIVARGHYRRCRCTSCVGRWRLLLLLFLCCCCSLVVGKVEIFFAG